VNGVSLSQALQRWYAGQSVRQVSTCVGWDCTLQCSGGPWMPTNQQCMTTTNQCANDYMVTQSSTGSTSNQQSQASIAAGNAAWEAQQKAQQGSRPENSDWSASRASTQQTGNAVGTVGASEPALTQAQQQQVLGMTQQ
jgi:hypothetical protein